MTNKKILILIFVVAFLTLLIGCLPGLTPPPPKGVISGRIMVPSSETTKDITGWIPVANATVTLIDSEGITRTVTTDENGYYTFTDIAVNANTIITATATINGNTVIIKDVIPQAVAADENYDAKTADAESTALALIVEELLEQGLDPEYINLEEIQDSDNFTEVVEQVTSILEENGNVTTNPGLDFTVGNVAEDIISPPVYIPPEEPTEPVYVPPITPTPTPAVELTGIEVSPETMTLFVGGGDSITSIIASYSYGPDASIALATCSYSSDNGSVVIVATGVVTGEGAGSATITISYTEGGITKEDTVVVTVNPILLTSIVVLPDTMTLLVGGSDTIDSVTAYYNNDTETEIDFGTCDYESSTTGVATVNNGVVTTEGEGTTIITVSYAEGGIIRTDTVEVTVNKPPAQCVGSYSYSWTTSIMDSTDFDFTVGMGWSGPFPYPPNPYYFFHPDETPPGYPGPIGGSWLFENIDFDITSEGQTFSVTSVTDDPDFAGFANLLTNSTNEGIWFGYMGDCDNIASAGGQKDVQESLVFSGTDVGTDFPGLVIQSISLTFNQIYLDPTNVNKLVLDFTIDIYAGLPNS